MGAERNACRASCWFKRRAHNRAAVAEPQATLPDVAGLGAVRAVAAPAVGAGWHAAARYLRIPVRVWVRTVRLVRPPLPVFPLRQTAIHSVPRRREHQRHVSQQRERGQRKHHPEEALHARTSPSTHEQHRTQHQNARRAFAWWLASRCVRVRTLARSKPCWSVAAGLVYM